MEFDIAAFRREDVFVPLGNVEKPFALDDDDAASGRMVASPSRRRLGRLPLVVCLELYVRSCTRCAPSPRPPLDPSASV
jgi:hypothetical protein